MKFFKRLIMFVVAVLALFGAVGLMLPADVGVERSTVIQAPSPAVFAYMNDLRNFKEWSPWASLDPATQYSSDGATTGIGAKMGWKSDKPEVGSGTQEIVESVQDKRIVVALDFGDMGNGRATYTLTPEGAGTRLTWGFATRLPYNPVQRWMGLVMDSLMGGVFEDGLRRIKNKLEKGAV